MSQPRSAPAEQPEPVFLFVCQGPGCGERGGQALLERMRRHLASSPARHHVRVCAASCMDSCATGPNILRAGGDVHTGCRPEEALLLLGREDARCAPPPCAPDRGAASLRSSS